MNYRIVKETLTYHDGAKEITYYIQRDEEGGWRRISPKFKTEEACRMALNEYILPNIEIEVIESFGNV